jgi:hypothetical protein
MSCQPADLGIVIGGLGIDPAVKGFVRGIGKQDHGQYDDPKERQVHP